MNRVGSPNERIYRRDYIATPRRTGECERCNQHGPLDAQIDLCVYCQADDLGGEYVTVLPLFEPSPRILEPNVFAAWGHCLCGRETDTDICPRCETVLLAEHKEATR